jgi:hypothetical protein
MATQAGVINLDDQAQNMQLRVGVGGVSLALAVAVVLGASGAGLAARLLVAPLFFVGVYGISAALFRVCGVTAIAGRRIIAGGTEPVADRVELDRLRRRGGMVIAVSAVVSLLATALLSLPSW